MHRFFWRDIKVKTGAISEFFERRDVTFLFVVGKESKWDRRG